MNIVAFGDSITEGRTGITPEQNWLYLLGKKLGEGYTLFNAGVGGNSAREAMARYDRDVLANHPDLIILEFGGNNHDPKPGHEARRVSNEEFASLLNEFRRKLPTGCQVVMVTFPPIVNEHHLYYPMVPEGKVDEEIQPQRQMVRDFAAENGWPLLDLYTLIWPRRDEFILPDGVHLTAAGNAFFAEKTYELLKAIL